MMAPPRGVEDVAIAEPFLFRRTASRSSYADHRPGRVMGLARLRLVMKALAPLALMCQ